MWPFRSTRDRIEMLREIRKPAPGAMWPWSEPTKEPTPVDDSVAIRVCTDFTRRSVVIDMGEVARLSNGLAAARELHRKLGEAIEALANADAVDMTDEVNGKGGEDG